MTVHYYTFGCKVNQYETNAISQMMSEKGYTAVPEINLADICIINSCTVTGSADTKLRQLVNRIRKENPGCIIIICGCYAQVYKDSPLLNMADIVVGENNKSKIPQLIENYLNCGQRQVDIKEHTLFEQIEKISLSKSTGKTRAIIKIQDGCDRFCSYCIIPYARGRSRSKALNELTEEARQLVQAGHKELVLVGINLSCYGADFNDGTTIADAVSAVCKTSGAERVRLGSIEPELLTPDIIKRLSQNKTLCPHFHLSLQSGCDRILSQMRRKYSTAEYVSIVNELRKCFNGCAITTDVMVGFPSETDEDFLESLSFIKKIGFAKVHVFPYSERAGTAAAKRKDQIPYDIRLKRAHIMSQDAKKSEQNYLSSLVGTTQFVLFEREKDDSWHQGHAPCYAMIKVKHCAETLWKQTRPVMVTSACDGYCIGEIIE